MKNVDGGRSKRQSRDVDRPDWTGSAAVRDVTQGGRFFDSRLARHVASFEREPFGFTHRLAGLDLFTLDSLTLLADKFRPDDYFVAGGAPSADTVFYSVPHGALHPREALDRLDTGGVRILLKRPENYDTRFAELLLDLLKEIGATFGSPLVRLARLQSSILISSSETITPFHFDPEVSFFFQIEGPKEYHLYSPSTLGETELEEFYRRGVVDIGQIGLAGRDPTKEYVFALGAGTGHHQPRNAPHWVKTGRARSISYVLSYETSAMRASDRTRAFNYYLRTCGFTPAAPGTRPKLDSLKAELARLAVPVGHRVDRLLARGRRS